MKLSCIGNPRVCIQLESWNKYFNKMAPDITINKLDPTDKDSIQIIANWYYTEWKTPIAKTIHRLTNQPNNDTLFQLFLTIENRIVATGGLCNNVNILNIHPQLDKFKPWIALLYTEKDHRNKGLGRRLLEQIELHAKEVGLTKIYLYTFTAELLYERCGWTPIERVRYKNHDTVIMGKEI